MTENDTFNYAMTGNVKPIPVDASPTDVMDTEEGWRMSAHRPMKKKEQKSTSNKTFLEYLMGQNEHISQYYTQIHFHMVPYKIYELFKSTKKVKIITDGGAISLKGLLGFVFADKDGTILLTCFGQPSGNDPLSFRSEICAFHTAVRLVQLLTQYYEFYY
jgi:hypothetical protein